MLHVIVTYRVIPGYIDPKPTRRSWPRSFGIFPAVPLVSYNPIPIFLMRRVWGWLPLGLAIPLVCRVSVHLVSLPTRLCISYAFV